MQSLSKLVNWSVEDFTIMNHDVFSDIIVEIQNTLTEFALSDDFLEQLQIVFGNDFDGDKANTIKEQWKNGNFEILPELEVRNIDELNGAIGAYSQDTNKIYLAQEYLEQNASNSQTIIDVLLHEIGHYIDAEINTVDTLGDEGAAFTALLRGEPLDPKQIVDLQNGEDITTIVLDGQTITIEQAQSISDSGGFEGSEQTITLESTEGGVAEFRYEHFTIPDNFIIRYEGRNLLRTGFVGGSKTGEVQIPKGDSDQLDILVTTNDEGTAWNYDVTVENCPDTGDFIIDGNFEDSDGDGDCETQDTFFIGRESGIGRMLRIEGGSAEYDENSLKVTGGTVFSLIGAGDVTSAPLFKGDFELNFGSGTASSFQETGTLANDFKVGGLDIDFSGLTVNRNGLALGAKFELVDEIGLPEFPFSGPDALLISQNDVRFGSSVKFSAPNFKDFKLFNFVPIQEFSDFSIEYIAPEDKIKIQGKLAVDFSSKPRTGEVVANFAGDNFIQVQGGKADIVGELTVQTDLKFPPKGWGLRELKLNIDTIKKDVVGGAQLTLPIGRTVKVAGELGFKLPIPPLEPNKLSLSVDNLNIPIPQFPGVFFQALRGAAENFGESDRDPIEFSGGVSATLGPQILGIAAIRFDADGKLSSEQFSGTGKVTVVNDKLLTAQGTATLDWNKKFFEAKGSFSLLDGVITTTDSFKVTSSFDVNMGGLARVGIPKSIPLVGGAQLASANYLLDFSNNGTLSDDFAAGWGTLNIQKFGFEASFVAGVKGFFDGRFERIGAKNIPSTNSFIVEPGTEWVVLGADWENEVTGNVAVNVEKPDGTIISEADFSATNRIAVVDELTDSTTKVVIVFDPEPGVWDIEVADPSGLGDIEYNAARDSVAPTINIVEPAVDVAGGNVNIEYEAFDADSDAEIKLFYDDDNDGFDGLLITDGLTETDGSGSFVWDTQGVPTGEYFIYGIVMDENNIPAFSYSSGKVNITEEADLSVTQNITPESIFTSDNFTYTLTVTNNGSSNSSGVVLTETLPEEVTLVSSSIAPSDQTDNVLTFDIGNLNNGESSTVDIVVTAPLTAGTLESEALISSATFDPDASNDIDVVTTIVDEIVPELPDLEVVRTDDSTTVSLDEDFTYNLTVTNNGPGEATGIVLTEALPSVVDGISATTPVSIFGNTLTANLGDLESGESETLTLTVDFFGAGNLTSVTDVVSNETDLDPSDNSLISTTQVNSAVPLPADLELALTVDNPDPEVGDEIIFTLTITNQGPGIASGIEVQNLLPDGLTFISASAEQGVYDSDTGIWDVGNVRDNLSRTLQINVTVDDFGSFTSTSEIIDVNEADPDSTPNNNDPQEDDFATVTVNAQSLADLIIDKVKTQARALIGENFTYEIQITNDGPNESEGWIVTETLPEGMSFVSATNGDITTVDNLDGTVTFSSDTNIPVGETRSFDVNVFVESFLTQGITLLNQVDIFGQNSDPNPDNNQDIEATPITAFADLIIDKIDQEAKAFTGQNFTYELQITNNGPGISEGWSVINTLPEGMSFVSATNDDIVAVNNPNGTVNFFSGTDIPAGETRSFDVTVFVEPDVLPGITLSNQVEVFGQNPDPNPTNNQDIEETPTLTGVLNSRGGLNINTNGLVDSNDNPLGINLSIDEEFQNNVVYTSDATDIVETGDGNDIVNAGNGNNFVDSEAGNDIIISGDSGDDLIGGKGADVLKGGPGLDGFIIRGDANEGAFGANSDLHFDANGKLLIDAIIDFNPHEGDFVELHDMRLEGGSSVSYHADSGNLTLTDNSSGDSFVIANLPNDLDLRVVNQGGGNWTVL